MKVANNTQLDVVEDSMKSENLSITPEMLSLLGLDPRDFEGIDLENISLDSSDNESLVAIQKIEQGVLRMSHHVPPEFEPIFQIFLKHESGNWGEGEINYSNYEKEVRDLHYENEGELKQILRVLAFFLIGDAIVTRNIGTNFGEELGHHHVIRLMLESQLRFENIHAITYASLVDHLPESVVSKKDKLEMKLSMLRCPRVKAIAEFMAEYMNPQTHSLSERIFAFVILEYIIFAGCFCVIYNLKRKNKLEALTQANSLIARDETLHADNGIAMYHVLTKLGEIEPLDQSVAKEILAEGVKVTCDLMRYGMDIEIVGLDNDDMETYIQSLANEMYSSFFASNVSATVHSGSAGIELPYPRASNPFPWMVNMIVHQLSNFFEKKETNYIGTLVYQDSDDDDDDDVDF